LINETLLEQYKLPFVGSAFEVFREMNRLDMWRDGKYAGKVLKIDLSSQSTVEEPLDQDLRQRFLGGRGVGAKILYDSLAPGTDPLSPDNVIILATGPLTGTSAPGSKLSIISKSPATGGYGDSAIGGHIGPEIRYAGYDVVVIKGRSAEPVYLWINNDHVEFRDASHLWGQGTLATEKHLKNEFGEDAQVLCIGPGGEKLVKFACISHALGRQAGRTGMGALLGSKNLKAIVVRGDGGIRLADPEAFQEKIIKLRKQILKNSVAMHMHEFGTAGHILISNRDACLPTRNYQSGVFEQAEAISGETMQEQIVVRHRACFGCTLACSKLSRVEGLSIEGPEYETLAMLGANCGIGNLVAVVKANHLCNDLGIDTISTGNIIAFAIECYERGIISDEDTGGLALSFGDEKAYFELIHKIGKREGIGDILAEGVREAAKKFGKGSEKFAMHSKGLEQSAYETRAGAGQVLAYAVNDRGADHNRIWTGQFFVGEQRHAIEGKAEMVKQHQCTRSAPDIMGVCRFVSYHIDFDDYGELITAATGIKTSGADILQAAERTFNLTRAFNKRAGFTRADDHVPARVLEEPLPDGPTRGAFVKRSDFEKMLDEFYEISGWDKTGTPTDAKLKELGLEDIVEDVQKLRTGGDIG
jgi:aldehyde:ferredoxin oxidoreductase